MKKGGLISPYFNTRIKGHAVSNYLKNFALNVTDPIHGE